MPTPLRNHDPHALADRLRLAPAMTRGLMREIIAQACRRLPSNGQNERGARVMRLVEAEAWADAALGLIDLELPLWRVRRLVYDEGEWHCALSRERELPDWLDSAIEAHHADLALALMSVFAEVQALRVEASRSGVPSLNPSRDSLDQVLVCENFG